MALSINLTYLLELADIQLGEFIMGTFHRLVSLPIPDHPAKLIKSLSRNSGYNWVSNESQSRSYRHVLIVYEYRTDDIDTFDDTPFVFDNVGVKNYLAGALKAGGPLVTTTDALARSDLGIFTSDSNATVTAMATSQTSFENACFPIFEKMINTVPGTNAPLSDPIGPRTFITMDSRLDLTSTGVLTYSGFFGTYGKTAAPSTVTYEYGTVGGGNTGTKHGDP